MESVCIALDKRKIVQWVFVCERWRAWLLAFIYVSERRRAFVQACEGAKARSLEHACV